ncbi:MAG: hypothetical protein ACI4TD_00660 [Phocaeicola sp.]
MDTKTKMYIGEIANILSEKMWSLQSIVDDEEANQETLETMSEETRVALDSLIDAIDCIDEAISILDEIN